VEKLLGILWAYRTTKRIPTDEISFSLAYGAEAIIPVDVSMPTFRTEGVEWDQNAAQLRLAQDQSEERRQQAQICTTTYQQQIRASHYKKVKPREFQVGDLVLKRVIQRRRMSGNSDPIGRAHTRWSPKRVNGHTHRWIKTGGRSTSNEILFT